MLSYRDKMNLKSINKCNQRRKSLPVLQGDPVSSGRWINSLIILEAGVSLSVSLRSFIWSCKMNQKCLGTNAKL